MLTPSEPESNWQFLPGGHSSELSEVFLALLGVPTALWSVDRWISSPSFSSQLIRLLDHLLKTLMVVSGLLVHKKALTV